MSRLRGLIRALDPRALESHARRVDSLGASTKTLRHELREIRGAMDDLTSQMGAVQRQMNQLVALQREDADAAVRLDRLEQIMDASRIGARVRDAVASAERIEHPVPHILIPDILPGDVYAAVIDAIPSPVFFDGEAAGGQTLRVPPRLAPTYSVATWSVLADVVKDVLAPALVERFREPLDRYARSLCPPVSTLNDAGITFAAEPGRIVLRQPGHDATATRPRPWQWLTVILCLARPDDGEEYGSRLYPPMSGVDALPSQEGPISGVKEIPFRSNSALAVLNPSGGHEYVSIPKTAPDGTTRYTCEVRIGLPQESRRILLAQMDAVAQGTWNAQR